MGHKIAILPRGLARHDPDNAVLPQTERRFNSHIRSNNKPHVNHLPGDTSTVGGSKEGDDVADLLYG